MKSCCSWCIYCHYLLATDKQSTAVRSRDRPIRESFPQVVMWRVSACYTDQRLSCPETQRETQFLLISPPYFTLFMLLPVYLALRHCNVMLNFASCFEGTWTLFVIVRTPEPCLVLCVHLKQLTITASAQYDSPQPPMTTVWHPTSVSWSPRYDILLSSVHHHSMTTHMESISTL